MYIGELKSVSNREDWKVPITVVDDDTDEAVDITGATITVAIRRQGCSSADMTLTVGSGVTITDADDGIFEFAFTVTQMRTLDPDTYDIGITVTIDGETTQLFSGTVPILDGVTN